MNTFLCAGLAAGIVLSAVAVAGPFAQPRPAVIELFTSQGCSSCPPAEALLGEFSQHPGVVELAFHVDYWDSLGWPDRFASPASTERQRQYARALGRADVYTPQVVVDGRDDFVGSDRGAIERALQGVRTGVPVNVAVSAGELVVDLGGGQCLSPSDVLLVAYLRRATSPIGRGENSGRTLQEFNIVRSIRPIGRWDGSMQRLKVALSSLPPDASDVALIVQAQGQGQIIGAATHALR